MLRTGRQKLWVLLILLMAIGLVAAACGSAGEQGVAGVKGVTGDKGAIGAKGPTGDKGAVGNKGATGDKGVAGAKGAIGNAGPTFPAKVVVVPTGKTSAPQPVSLTKGARQPLVTIYGTGFPASEIILVEVIGTDGVSIAMEYLAGSPERTDATGAFKTSVRTDISGLTLSAGSYALVVTSLSGVTASAPVAITEPPPTPTPTPKP